ncbi:MAG TPA: carboxypeptidase regulatory-like domain-containing protein [Bacillota bacterium]|nr:carboxypeptidase regulatory-like domain-containing protein [Bacillota bacterium]
MFISFNRLNKFFASLLVVVMLMTQSLALVPAYAATGGNAYGQNETTDDLTTKEKTARLLNQIIPHSIQNSKQQGPDWLKSTDISLSFADDLKPLYSLETFQLFSKEPVDGRLGFWQGRYAHRSSSDNTLNLGVGLRWLSEDKSTIKGINAFYDYGFKHDLSRLGIGAEYFKNRGEFRFNFYLPLSNDRFTSTTAQADGILYSYIRAVNGFDFELGTSLVNAPWLNLYASGFHYDNKHNADEDGYKLRTKMQITPKLSMEMGYSNSNLTSGDFYGKILFQLNNAAGPALYGSNTEAISSDISYKLLQKVERENDIKTETWDQLAAYTGEIHVTVTTDSGSPLQGALVQAYQNGKPAGIAATTGADGKAVLKGLSAGEYIVRADYFSASGNSPAVTVQKDQPADTAISLTVTGGNANVHVIDSTGISISGATVTAEAVGGSQGSWFSMAKNASTAAFTVTAVTGGDGIARFTYLPAGNYRFTVTDNARKMKSLAVNVTNGATSHGTVVLPASGGNIVAVICDATSKAAINGATVVLKNSSTVIEEKTTDSGGTAIFSGLAAGITYTLTASAANYDGNSTNIKVIDKETVAAGIALTPQNSEVIITVTNGTNPLQGATVRLTGNGEDRTATTNDSGEATFTNVPTGTYTVEASRDGYHANTTSVTVVSGQTASVTVDITRQTGSITLKVTNGTNPLSDVAVRLTGNGVNRSSVTNNSGEVSFTNIPTGTYTVEASKDSYETVSQEVTVVSNQTETVTIALTQITTETIRVTDGTNRLSGVTVSVTVNGQVITKTTNSQGMATFKLPSYNLYTFTFTKEGYHTKTITVWVNGGTELFTESLTRQTGNATITVTDGTNPLKGATVRLTGNGEDRNATTNDSGEASFANIPTGTYTLAATMDGYETGSQTVTVVRQQTETATIALAREMITVQIDILSDTGTKLSFASVNITGNGINDTKETSWNGGVTFTLPAGTYTLTATHTYYRTISQELVVSRENNTFDLTTTRKVADIVFVVLDSDGHPLSGAVISKSYSDPVEILGYTDGTGRFELKNQPAGNYAFDVTKEFYNGWTSVVTVNQDGVIEKTFTLTRQTGNVRITVKNSSEAGIAGATVTLSDGSVHIANSIGIVKMDNVPAGEMSITASASGYVSRSVTRTINKAYNSYDYNEVTITLPFAP